MLAIKGYVLVGIFCVVIIISVQLIIITEKNSMEIRDEMCRITDHSFLRFITFGTTRQNLVFIIARRFLNSASSEVNSLILKLF